MPGALSLFRSIALVSLVLGAASLAAQQDVTIEKHTNGVDADSPPGPVVTVGSTVNWEYIVSNTGSRMLSNIVVTDDQGVTVTCPSTTLDAGLSMTCTGSGTATVGQYSNIGTVDAVLPDMSPVSDSDPSHYFGQAAPSIDIEKSTEGFDADTAPGPILPVGSTVHWTYMVMNIGTDPLTNVAVTDDQGVTVTCPKTTLAVGESMTCTASGIVQQGQYANVGSVTAELPDTSTTGDTDPSHYYGQAIVLEKFTNGVDVDSPPGPTLMPGEPVTWTYQVTNPGPATVTNLAVTDDQEGAASCPQTTLLSGETVTCTASGTVIGGQYVNSGTATADLPLGGQVSDTDPSYYIANLVDIQKFTNGVDADTIPGPVVSPGDTVNWTYVVTNFSPTETLTGITVTDSEGVTVTCPVTTLNPGESMTCTASDVAISGQYANLGTVDATASVSGAVSAADPSHYFGQNEVLDFGDAPDPTYPVLFASNGARHVLGSGVYLGACVDAENDGFASANATGDDTNAGASTFGTCAVPGDDEDGVTFTTPVLIGLIGNVDVVANEPCTLSAWIDFNRNGSWIDAGDDLFPGGQALSAGVNSLTFSVPVGASAGTSYARFRCTTEGAVDPDGHASDGEVEDYQVEILTPTPDVSATKSDALLVDNDSDTNVDPGDTIRYTITITNSGTGDATGVMLSDTPDANTSLVAGSVTTSQGTVTTGNGGGDTSVAVDVGTLASFGGTVTITFDVVVRDPLPLGVASVSNQGTVSGTNFSDVSTDDPDQGGASDPTVTPVQVPPDVSATKTDALQVDNDSDGNVDPGDTIRYTITITNSGTGDALNVVLNDTPDANTALVVGSVTTTQGTVTTGNGGGDTSVSVDVGTIAGLGATVTITFDVVVDDPLALGVDHVNNQGTVSGSNFGSVSTDDPDQAGAANPTLTPISAPPDVTAEKTVAVTGDADSDGNADPGDTLTYTIVINNAGTGDANNVVFTDTPDGNTNLVVGSVTTTQGTITTGNTAGDTSVAVDAGTIPGLGGTVTITFDVLIRNPFPTGVQFIVNTGNVSGSNVPSTSTDDPNQPGSADATAIAITGVIVPTLDEWALIALMMLIGLVAVRRMT